MGPLIPALVGGLASSIASGTFASGSQRKQYKYNLALQRQQQAWQKHMWDLENMYNLPTNEVKRLMNAGVNPALAFSNAGAGAAPVPQSGSAGGVSAPTVSFGNPVVEAAQTANLDADLKLKNSQSEVNKAEADRIRKEAGLTEQNTRIVAVKARIMERNEEVLNSFPGLARDFKQLNYALGYNEFVRSETYTANYPDILRLNMERQRLDNRNIDREYNLIGERIEQLKREGVLTLQQAENLRQQCRITVCQAYYAEYVKKAQETLFDRKYDFDTGEYRPFFDEFVRGLEKEFAERFASASVGLAAANNQLGFEKEYGLGARFYQGYEGPRRQANATRNNMYVSWLASISGVVTSAISVSGATGRLRQGLQRSRQSTDRMFNPYGSIHPDGSFDVY